MRPDPPAILVRGAAVHNLRHVDADVPLRAVVALAGPSGSGKSSLALGVLHAEGLRRFLRGFAPQLQRQAGPGTRAQFDRIDFLPPAVALRQHPPRPGPRSTAGTLAGLLTPLRVLVSRAGVHPCPHGHPVGPFTGEATDCPQCGARTRRPTADSFAFNGSGACPDCGGTGERRDVDLATLVPDETRTITEGAVAAWSASGRSHMPSVVAELGVRVDVPWAELTPQERDVVLAGKPVDREVLLVTKKGRPIRFNATYDNAVSAVRKASAPDSTATLRKRMEKFLRVQTCATCRGTRLRPEALHSTVAGRGLADILSMTLAGLDTWLRPLPSRLPGSLREPARVLAAEVTDRLAPLLALGAGYLTADRDAATLSTGELQRIQLATTVLGRATGTLYVLDEPSIGLHPENVAALGDLLRDLVADGNSVVLVDHDPALLRGADHLIELGPGAGREGGTVVATGSPAAIGENPRSVTGAFLSGRSRVRREPLTSGSAGELVLSVSSRHNLDDVTATFPIGRLTAVTGVSGAGKTALVLESLVPAVEAAVARRPAPEHVPTMDGAGSLRRVLTVDATPIGRNSRSTPATYSGVFDGVREMLADRPEARRRGWGAGHFSYNNAEGQCPECEGLGEERTDLLYLPEVTAACSACGGSRYAPEVLEVLLDGHSVAGILAMTVREAADFFAGHPFEAVLRGLDDVGLGYLVLGEPTPSLAGGEAQRLKLAKELAKGRPGTLYVLDEPTTGLHPADVAVLLGVFDRLIARGGTVVVVEHDLDVVANADHIVDLGPGGGPGGGRVVVQGTPAAVAACAESVTGKWLRSAGVK
jgi:excinuclease ABC subunit A